MVPGEGAAQPLDEGDHVRPGDEADVGQSVVGGREAEAGDEHAVVVLGRDGGGVHVVDADERGRPRGGDPLAQPLPVAVVKVLVTQRHLLVFRVSVRDTHGTLPKVGHSYGQLRHHHYALFNVPWANL